MVYIIVRENKRTHSIHYTDGLARYYTDIDAASRACEALRNPPRAQYDSSYQVEVLYLAKD